MEPTRRFWVVAGLATASAVLAVLFGNILWLGIPIGITAWVLIDQLAFTTTLAHATSTQPVQQTISHDTVIVNETATLELHFDTTATQLATLDTTLELTTHPAITIQASRTHTLNDITPRLSIPLQIDAAGTYTINPPRIHTTSHRGLFRETLQLGNTCSVTGTPRVPRDIHIGTAGERIAIADGEHDASQGEGGFDPGELREYLPGDPTNRIDWNATARLGEPYIREIEAETTRQTHLIVDQRSAMHSGPTGLTKLDHARKIALWLTEYTTRLGDPLALTLVADNDITGSPPANATTAHYQRIRHQLRNLTTTTPTAPTQPSPRTITRSSQEAHETAATLTDNTTFSRTLRPYFQHVDAYLERVTTDPLFKSVQSRLADHAGDAWIVIITDDTNRAELLETTRMAAGGDTYVSVFLLPSVLFDEQAFTNLEDAYADYRDFEEFRQQLAATTNTSAFEVGPRDRLTALLDAAPTRRSRQ